MADKCEVGVYYFPNYHIDKRNDKWHGAGWNEWRLVKAATPRFPGHDQPKVPLWGYEDESDPKVMEKKIDAAADHGITSFIFDWYWYEDGPYLQRCLEDGFLKAKNNDKLKFSLMWANHDWVDIHPAQRSVALGSQTLARGEVSYRAFYDATEHMIQNYFCHPSYWRVNGGLYLSFYMIAGLVSGLGDVPSTRKILDELRERVRKAGLGELHLNAVVWGQQILPGEKKAANVNELLDALGFDSVTSYVWIHHHEMPDFPETDYAAFAQENIADFEKFTQKYQLPYYPNVSMGWDPSPRTIQTDDYEYIGYPYTPTLSNNTPEEFEKALRAAKSFLEQGRTNPKILTINAWNEWTEGSYLEPDTKNGYGYLKAIQHVFG